MSKDINTQPNNSEEVDLGQLFKLIGNMFDRFFKFLGSLFNKLFLIFVWAVFFVKTHIIKLLIAAALGFGYGFIKERSSKPIYKSSVLISQNYQTGENVYNSINYYNGLLSNQDYIILAQELSIDTAFVSTISSFGVEALITENQRLIEFSNYSKRLDSTLASTISYKDYKDNVKEHIYTQQLLTINSTTNENFNVVFEAIIAELNSNPYFLREQAKDLEQLEQRKSAIDKALVESDSLQMVYKKVLENVLETNKGSQTSITIEGSDEKGKTKELDLYKSNIELRNELVTIEREKQNKQFIIELLSNTPSRGFVDTSIKVLGKTLSQKMVFAGLFAVVLFCVLFLLRVIKFLEKYKNEV